MTIKTIKAISVTSEERKNLYNALKTLKTFTTLYSQLIHERNGNQVDPLDYSLNDIYELLECDDAYTIL